MTVEKKAQQLVGKYSDFAYVTTHDCACDLALVAVNEILTTIPNGTLYDFWNDVKKYIQDHQYKNLYQR